MSEPILTETIVDIADCHTTFFYFTSAKAIAGRMPLGSDQSYVDLYEKIALRIIKDYGDLRASAAAMASQKPDSNNSGNTEAPGASVNQVSNSASVGSAVSAAGGSDAGQSGNLLRRLAPAYKDDKYWSRYLRYGPASSYSELAWEALLPIQASITTQLQWIPYKGAEFKVSPIPSVLLYPFGWSGWISLRITGEHTVSELADLMKRAFSQKIFRFGNAARVAIGEVFAEIARGVRTDAFGGSKTRDVVSQNITTITTVLAKHGGSPAPRGLTMEEQAKIFRIASPAFSKPLPKNALKDRVFDLPPKNDLSYMVYDTYGRFMWLEHLLHPIDRQRQKLRCYHNNIFRSFIQAWHLYSLLKEVPDRGISQQDTPMLCALLTNAIKSLERPLQDGYRNASLLQFLSKQFVADCIKAARIRVGLDKS